MRIEISILFLAVVFVAFVSTQKTTTKAPAIPSFDAYKAKYSKKYTNSTQTKSGKTEAQAKAIYAKNVAAIQSHNSQKNKTYVRSVNRMSDMSEEELSKFKRGYNATMMKAAVKSINDAEKKKKKNGTNYKSTLKKFDPVKAGYNASLHSSKMLKAALSGNMDLRPKMSPVKGFFKNEIILIVI